jgi:hypothetical protein
MTPETINEINREEYVYQQWLREQKNKILAMHDVKKKQAAWHRIFPPYQPSEVPY